MIKKISSTLWKYKLWWGIPIILVLTVTVLIVLTSGQTSVSSSGYPIF